MVDGMRRGQWQSNIRTGNPNFQLLDIGKGIIGWISD
jgi:hypothetical protein